MPTIVGRCSYNLFDNFDFINERVENVCSSSTLPNTWTASISANLKISIKQFFNSQKMDKVHYSRVKEFTWNGSSIATTTLAFMVHLKMLCCKFMVPSARSVETLENYLATCPHNNSDFWSTWNVIQNFAQHHHGTNIEVSKPPMHPLNYS